MYSATIVHLRQIIYVCEYIQRIFCTVNIKAKKQRDIYNEVVVGGHMKQTLDDSLCKVILRVKFL